MTKLAPKYTLEVQVAFFFEWSFWNYQCFGKGFYVMVFDFQGIPNP